MKGKYSLFILVLIITVILVGCIEDLQRDNSNGIISDDSNETVSQNISIACWNLQVFGPSKSSNESLLEYYSEKLDEYDIFIIQEIRDASGDAIETIAMEFPEYQYIMSNRAGQSSSKEQYAVFYNEHATLIESYDYQLEYQDDMQRPPLKCTFISNNWTFTIYTVHTQPDNVAGELSILETIIGNPTSDTLIIGDLNADGGYYDEDEIQHFKNWDWVITNDLDTTVAVSDNTYDRIIINDAAENNLLSAGVMDEVNKDQSDHYLVYGYFNNKLK